MGRGRRDSPHGQRHPANPTAPTRGAIRPHKPAERSRLLIWKEINRHEPCLSPDPGLDARSGTDPPQTPIGGCVRSGLQSRLATILRSGRRPAHQAAGIELPEPQHFLAGSATGDQVEIPEAVGDVLLQVAIASEDMRKMPIIRMNAEFERVHPAARSRQILALTGQLETLALAKKPATVTPLVYRTFTR